MLGILGGMGPLATALFYQRVIEATPARRDQDHLPLAIWADPTVPDRSAALLGDVANPTPWLVRGAKILAALGADLIAVPCNSARPFLREAQEAVDVPLIDIVQTTVRSTFDSLSAPARISVLCTRGAYQTGLYQERLAAFGMDVFEMRARDRFRVQVLINRIKAGHEDPSADLLDGLVAGLQESQVDVVILGCTELTAVRDRLSRHFVVMDSATMLARASVLALRGEESFASHGNL
jgi:aspartate racemase